MYNPSISFSNASFRPLSNSVSGMAIRSSKTLSSVASPNRVITPMSALAAPGDGLVDDLLEHIQQTLTRQ